TLTIQVWNFYLTSFFFPDRNSMRNACISPESPEIERGSTLKLLCILGNYDMPYRNASHIIWKLNQNLIAQENYNIINETVAGLIPCLCIILSLVLWFDFVI
uniref:Immunoglobulin C2-set-like ligand-binding domain-containing protein n=1 Tax=Gopherus agassizii TaxID=38772 RepID=A0A452H6G2_9SAUR